MRAKQTTRQIPPERDPVARRVGERIRAARVATGMTQQQLAGDRYTKAYVSALENAHIKPSVAALDYLAGRLGTTASRLMAVDEPQWRRLDADLRLAAGDWPAAADAYAELAATSVGTQRAEVLRGLAEALYRQRRSVEAERAAAESVQLFERLGREADAAAASYWLSAALYAQDNVDEAKAILQALLARIRAGLDVEPAFRLRLVMALATNEAREGNHAIALSYLEEIRALADTLDDRRRAIYLFDLAYSDRATGDFEAALRAGYASLALFAAVEMDSEIANTENDLALCHLALGNTRRAEELVASARRRLEELHDERLLAHVVETEAQIAAVREDWAGALRLAAESIEMAGRTDNPKAAVNALLTSARAHLAMGEPAEAVTAYERAAELARHSGRPGLLRKALTGWAELLADAGDHATAYRLQREALSAG